MDKADDGKGSDLKMVGWRGVEERVYGGGGCLGGVSAHFMKKGCLATRLSYCC